jgi:hypothetical protein
VERLIATRDKYWLTFDPEEYCNLPPLWSEEKTVASERDINPKFRYPIRHAGQMTKCQLDEFKEWLTKTLGCKDFEGGVWGRQIIAFIYLAMLEE